MENDYILVDFRGSSQVDLERALSHFTQLRNHFHSPATKNLDWWFTLLYILADCVGQAANKTLIARGHPDYHDDISTQMGRHVPRILPTHLIPGPGQFYNSDFASCWLFLISHPIIFYQPVSPDKSWNKWFTKEVGKVKYVCCLDAGYSNTVHILYGNNV